MTSATDVLDLVRNTVRIATWKVSLDGVSSETRIAIGRIRFLVVPRAGGSNFAFSGVTLKPATQKIIDLSVPHQPTSSSRRCTLHHRRNISMTLR